MTTYRSPAAPRNRADLLHDVLRLLTVFNQQRAVLLASPLLHHRDPERAAAIPGFERAILPTGLRMLAAMIESQWRVFDPTVQGALAARAREQGCSVREAKLGALL